MAEPNFLDNLLDRFIGSNTPSPGDVVEGAGEQIVAGAKALNNNAPGVPTLFGTQPTTSPAREFTNAIGVTTPDYGEPDATVAAFAQRVEAYLASLETFQTDIDSMQEYVANGIGQGQAAKLYGDIQGSSYQDGQQVRFDGYLAYINDRDSVLQAMMQTASGLKGSETGSNNIAALDNIMGRLENANRQLAELSSIVTVIQDKVQGQAEGFVAGLAMWNGLIQDGIQYRPPEWDNMSHYEKEAIRDFAPGIVDYFENLPSEGEFIAENPDGVGSGGGSGGGGGNGVIPTGSEEETPQFNRQDFLIGSYHPNGNPEQGMSVYDGMLGDELIDAYLPTGKDFNDLEPDMVARINDDGSLELLGIEWMPGETGETRRTHPFRKYDLQQILQMTKDDIDRTFSGDLQSAVKNIKLGTTAQVLSREGAYNVIPTNGQEAEGFFQGYTGNQGKSQAYMDAVMQLTSSGYDINQINTAIEEGTIGDLLNG